MPEDRTGEPEPDGGLPELGTLADLLALLARHPGGLFLRWSGGPGADARGGSLDHESGLPLPGLSVTVLAAPGWWTRPVEDWPARQVHRYSQLGREPGRYGWVLTGREVGRGPDHEPLLDGVRPLARLGPALVDEAGRRYRERFDAGRDSRGG